MDEICADMYLSGAEPLPGKIPSHDILAKPFMEGSETESPSWYDFLKGKEGVVGLTGFGDLIRERKSLEIKWEIFKCVGTTL